MTPIAALVAEAIAKAEAETEDMVHCTCRYLALPIDHLEAEPGDGEFDDIGAAGEIDLARDIQGQGFSVVVVRLDAFDAALTHLATRAAEAEEKLGVMTLSRLEVMARTEEAMEQTDKALANTAKAIAALEAAVAAGNAWKAKAAEAEGRAERAEARIVKLRATLDAAAQASGANAVIDLCDNALCVDILDADQPDADAAVPRG